MIWNISPSPFFAAIAPRATAAGLDPWSYPRAVQDDLDAIRAGTLPPEQVERWPRRWRVTAAPGPAVIAAPYWRHMRAATADGMPVALAPDPDWGRIALTVPDRAGPVEIRIPWHWSERAGAALSAIGILAGIGAAPAGARRRRRGAA